MNNGTLLRMAKWLWLGGVAVAAAVYVALHASEVVSRLQSVPKASLALSFGLLIVGKLLLGKLSQWSVQSPAWSPGFGEMVFISSLTQLAKYLPGGIWHFVGRIGAYRAKRVSFEDAGRAVLVENLWLVMSALWTGAAFFLPTALAGRLPSGGIALVVLLVLVLGILGNGILDGFHRPQANGRLFRSLGLSGLQFGCWVALGLSFWVLFPQLGPGLTLMAGIGVFGLAWVAGFLSVFAPGGIGVREMALGFLLSGFLPPAQAVFLAAVHRMIWITGEILLGVVASLSTDLGLYREQASGHPPSEEPTT